MSDRKRAIETLKQLRLDYEEFYEEHNNEVTQAYDMAISSLETDEAYQLEYESTTKNSLAVDAVAVSRQALIDWLKNWTLGDASPLIDFVNSMPPVTPQESITKDLAVDAVSRQELLKIYENRFLELQKLKHLKDNKGAEDRQLGVNYCINILKELPSVTPQLSSELEKNSKKLEKNFGESDCISRAEVLKLMQDNWHTHNGDWAMQESMDDIRALPAVTPQEPRWIPVSEKLPNDRDCYLGIFKEPDTGWINPLPFICDYVGRETKTTTKDYWCLRGFTDWDDYHIDYYFNLECVAWMPLPQNYEEVEE